MRATQPFLAKGMLGRSVEEFMRLTSIAWRLEAVKGPSASRPLYDFHTKESVNDCLIMSDHLIGGLSTSTLDFISPTQSNTTTKTSSSPPPSSPTSSKPSSTTSKPPQAYSRFHGSISTALPPDRPKIKRTGYAAFRTPEQSPTVFGRSYWDIDPYTYLAMRIKSDGRAYFVNIQTESVEPSDLHQHRLFAKRPGEWETVLLKWNDFVRTNYGFVVEPQTEMLRQKVRTLGVGLTDRVEGPFELCIERIWATNDVKEGDTILSTGAEKEDVPGTELKTRKGNKVHW